MTEGCLQVSFRHRKRRVPIEMECRRKVEGSQSTVLSGKTKPGQGRCILGTTYNVTSGVNPRVTKSQKVSR